MPAADRPFIKVDPHVADDTKVLDLADELGEESYVTVGRLVRLWGWAFDHCPDGDLSKVSERHLRTVMGLGGKHLGDLRKLLGRYWPSRPKRIHPCLEAVGGRSLRQPPKRARQKARFARRCSGNRRCAFHGSSADFRGPSAGQCPRTVRAKRRGEERRREERGLSGRSSAASRARARGDSQRRLQRQR